jgi:hypothetical protein
LLVPWRRLAVLVPPPPTVTADVVGVDDVA